MSRPQVLRQRKMVPINAMLAPSNKIQEGKSTRELIKIPTNHAHATTTSVNPRRSGAVNELKGVLLAPLRFPGLLFRITKASNQKVFLAIQRSRHPLIPL